MSQYKYPSAQPIIERMIIILENNYESDSKKSLIKEYERDSTFKSIAINIGKWKIKYIDNKPDLKKELSGELKAFEEYLTERKVIRFYRNPNIKKQRLILEILGIIAGLFMIYSGIREEINHEYGQIQGSIVGNRQGLPSSIFGLVTVVFCSGLIYTKTKK